MTYLKLLVVLYVSFCLLWSLILIYYLTKALVSRRQPSWLQTILRHGYAGHMVLYGSVVISPLFILFSVILFIKKLLGGDVK